MLKRWVLAAGVATSFLTRLPVPAACHTPAPEDLRRAAAFFPLVGALVGAITAGVVVLGAHFWPTWLAVILALAVEARLTGAFHEDAVGDAFDAFGGGFTRERVLEILKDSRLGSYGVLALVLALALRAGATATLPEERLVPAIVCAAALGRWFGVVFLWRCPTIPERAALSRDLGGVGAREVAIGGLFAGGTLAWLGVHAPVAALCALVVGIAACAWASAYVRRRIGGVTGDAIGTLTYAVQVATLLAASARVP
ncbi:MAG: adenosylcobinamide-GDP ribazoletransferase [Planctomycetota bacterium]|nr:adenosylcobinamide-GDP ribazoletransferase [Planctomycetota bacterium]